jgi:ATP/maltotriose-dependent transcriptional regulator MalT
VLAATDDEPRALTRRLRDSTNFATQGSRSSGGTVVVENAHFVQRPDAAEAFDAWLAETRHDHRVITLAEFSPYRPTDAARRRIVEIGGKDLAFTHAEIDALVASRGLPATPGFVDALFDITRGWAAGVDIATRWLLPEARGGFNAAIVEVREFVVSFVLPSLPENLQRFVSELAATTPAEVRLLHSGAGARPSLVQDALDHQLLIPADGLERRLVLHPYLTWALRTRSGREQRAVTNVPPRTALLGATERQRTPARRPSGATRRPYHLTRREADVLMLLPSALTLREIAATLCVSHDTVKSHSRSIYRKLSVTSREDAVSTACAARLLE